MRLLRSWKSAGGRLAAGCLAGACLAVLGSVAQPAVAVSAALHPIVAENLRTGRFTTHYVQESGLQERTASAQAATPGPHKVAVILISFPGDPSEPWSAGEARSEVFTGFRSANSFYEEESYGQISLTGKLRADGDVFGWYRLNAQTAGCPYQEWVKKADEAAAAGGVELNGYQNLIYMFPHQSSCFWSGLAGVSGGGVIAGGAEGALINGNPGVQTISHELGHTFGLLHAGSWTCTAGGVRVQISDNCTANEYGDPFDVMGNIATRHSSGWNLAKLGILAPENIETIDASGTYSMRSALHPTAEPTVLRIAREREPDGKVASWYYLEVRERGGVFEDVADLSTTGVSIRVAPNPTSFSPETLLLDANPATATFQDAPLAAGETFDAGPVKVKTLSAGAGAGAATVSVELDEEAPTVPTDLTATGGVERARLEWGASTDNFGVERYRVFRDGAEVGTSTSTEFVDSSAPVGDHEYVVYAEDATGNRSAASDPATATVEPDEEPPTAPAGVTATAGVEGLQLEWDASSDNVGVTRYRVRRDGGEVGTSTSTSLLDSLVPAGDHEYVVYAEDAAGNRSAASAPLTTTVPGISGPSCAGDSCRLTFRYTGAAATWTIPPGVSEADFTVEGARGGSTSPQSVSGRGARIVSTIGSLGAGEEATVSPGGMGETAAEGGAGGFNGGGEGGRGGGGGGFSSVALGSTLMLLAGGGGGDGANGFNSTTEEEPAGGGGGRGGVEGTAGSPGRATTAQGATLGKGAGGEQGGSGGTGGAGGGVTGASTCPGGANAGASGAPGSSLAGGGGEAAAGGGGGGGYVGGGQGGGGGGDACGDAGGSGGGGGGSSYAAPGLPAEVLSGFRRAAGAIAVAYSNPISAPKRSFSSPPGQELSVPAGSGLLPGASGPSGDPLSASLLSPPDHGSVTVSEDGSFTYMPASGYSGADSFAYRVADDAGDYATAQVDLTIATPPSVLISSPSGGGTYEVGQAVPTAFSCAEGSGGPGVLSCDDSTGVATENGGSGLLDTSTAGNHTYTVTAVSKDGQSDSTAIGYLVLPKPEPPNLPERPREVPRGVPPKLNVTLEVATGSLRGLLRTGKLDVVARVNRAARLMLSAGAKLAVPTRRGVLTKLVDVFKGRAIAFAAGGRKEVALTLSENGREALRRLATLRLSIAGKATDDAGEMARRTVAATLKRER
jgi:hypothetical protein